MSKTAAAPAEAAEDAAPAAKKGKKKLVIIIAAAVLLAAVGGGAAIFMMKKKAAAEAAELAEGEDGEHADAGHGAAAAHKVDVNHPPVFVPLDPFVVNLADTDADRYAQIAVTLQVSDAKFADQLKTFMPAVRNSILMILAHKTSHELLQRSGKEALAGEIMREAVRPMGINIDAPEAAAHEGDGEKGEKGEKGDEPKKKKKKSKEPAVENPIQQVHFANFIIQ